MADLKELRQKQEGNAISIARSGHKVTPEELGLLSISEILLAIAEELAFIKAVLGHKTVLKEKGHGS